MPKCKISGCEKSTRHNNTRVKYCSMHLARIQRHGYPELKRDRGEHGLEKLPHKIVDNFILKNYTEMLDKEIADSLNKMGYSNITPWNVRYRRRKLGHKKYLHGEILKHKAWIRAQALEKYGKICELCDYNMIVDTHHIVPKYQGGPHEIENLMIICPNCHALITRGYIKLNKREDISKIRMEVLSKIKKFYDFM